MGRFKKFLEAQGTTPERQVRSRGKTESGIPESKAALARRAISKQRRPRVTNEIREKVDLLAAQSADLARLISAKLT